MAPPPAADTHTVDPATETACGNLITYRGRNFHSVGDANPTGLDDTPMPKGLEMANAVARLAAIMNTIWP